MDKDSKIVLMVLIGIPGAGKSTLADMLKKSSDSCLQVVILSFDNFISLKDQYDLVTQIQSEEESMSFKFVRNQYFDMVNKVINSIQSGAVEESVTSYLIGVTFKPTCKYLIVLDDNFYYRSMRYKIYQMASLYHCGFCQVYLKCHSEVAKERNKERSEPIAGNVIDTMIERLEPPSSHNTWENQSILFDSDKQKLSVEHIFGLVNDNFSNPVSIIKPCLSKVNDTNVDNLVHNSDIILRSLVGSKIRSMKMNGIKVYSMSEIASLVNKIRQEILQELRNFDLEVPDQVIIDDKIDSEKLREFITETFENCCVDTF